MFPTPRYPPLREKSTLLIRLRFRLNPGKLEKTVMEGRCINLMALSVASDVIDKISDVGLNLRVETDVVRFRTIFSGFGRAEVRRFARLRKKMRPVF